MKSFVDSGEVMLQSLGRRALLTTTRPDLANDQYTVLRVQVRRDEVVLAPFCPRIEEQLDRDRFCKSLLPVSGSYCYAVVYPEDRSGVAGELIDLLGADYVRSRASQLLYWCTCPNWFENRSHLASPTTCLEQLERDIARTRSRGYDISQASALLERARKFIPAIERALFQRCYQQLVCSSSVGEDAAAVIVGRATARGDAFQVAYGPEFLTIAFWEVVPEREVVAVLPTKLRDPKLPFFAAKVGMNFLAKNLTPPRWIGEEAPEGGLRYGDYQKTFEESYFWIASKALEGRGPFTSFSPATTKQMVKLVNAPTGVELGFI